MNATEFLKQIKKIDSMIENKLAEANQWRAMAHNITSNMSGERTSSTPNPRRTEEAIAKYMDLEREARQCRASLIAAKQDIISTIEQLNAIDYDVLHKLYIQDWTLQDVASKYGHGYTWATTVHKRAKENLQKILDERERINARCDN